MDCTRTYSRTHSIAAHAATAGALMVCLAIVGGVGRSDKVASRGLRLGEQSSAPVWTTASVDPAPAPAAPAPILEAASTSPVVADLPPPIVVNNVALAAVIPEVPLAEPDADVVGLWAPDAGSCSLRNFRQGLLPTIISTEGAWAGDPFCMFKNRRPTESGWRVVAECSSGGDHWTTQVRLSLKGQRLIWDSKRGRQVYTRCSSDLRMAAAP
jgi:hypothetical protein